MIIKNSIFVKILVKWCDICMFLFIEILMIFMLLKFFSLKQSTGTTSLLFIQDISFINHNLHFVNNYLSFSSIVLYCLFVSFTAVSCLYMIIYGSIGIEKFSVNCEHERI